MEFLEAGSKKLYAKAVSIALGEFGTIYIYIT
jgi:hypothetical protein